MARAAVAGLLLGAVALPMRAEGDRARIREQEQARIDTIARVSGAVVSVLGPEMAGGGSGVIISPDGYGITNFHVVMGLLEKRTGVGGLPDGRQYPLEVVGIDPTGDLAMFRLSGRDRFDAVQMGDSDRVQPGDPVLALGNPFMLAEDYVPTATCGIVSGTHRYQYGADARSLLYTDCIQIDASINPGNSGGPLFDMAGRLIGINGRASFLRYDRVKQRVNVGVAYAISINQVKRFIPALRQGWLVEHGSLGATVADSPAGPVFDRVLRPSAAAGAGIEVGDRLVAFDGRPTPGANAFANLLGVYPAGWPVSVAYRRGETEMRRELVLDPLPIRGKISWPKADPMWVRAVAAGAATMPAPVALATMPAGTGAGEAPAVESFRDVVPAILPGLVKIHGGSIAREAGYASGVLVSAEGEVVTALSVLLDAADLRVITADGDVHTATVKYRDEYRQLALLSIQDLGVAGEGTVRGRATGHRPVVLDEGASPQAGDTILVAGNPFKIAGGDEPCSVTRGILSGRIRLDARRAGGGPGVAYHGEVLIMDAMASNVGSAGSAVFDGQGRWIGLVGEVVESRLTNTLLNYAFTAREVADFLRDARAGGATPARPVDVAASLAGYHGIRLSRLAYRQRLPFVESVVRDSPAARAGVQAGDLVVSVNGAAIPRSQAFDEVCGRLHPGDEMSIIVKRGNALKTLRVTLAEVPK